MRYSSNTEEFLPEDKLNDLVNRGVFSVLDYVTRHSQEMKDEYDLFCTYRGYAKTLKSARLFLDYWDEQLENGMAAENA